LTLKPPFIDAKYHLKEPVVYAIECVDKSVKYLKRLGRCNPGKHGCGSLCCRIICENVDLQDPCLPYREKFGEVKRFIDAAGRERSALILCTSCASFKEGKCAYHASRPSVCYHFPSPLDTTYLAVKDKCSFKFVEISKREYDRIKKKQAKTP